ncbi:sigma E protease regulator RseP [Granulosicoccaceae sp. 1_MG-2023]|nr:sigma E protease regulator RseP [Granulosicoccaceae sp. 1_MG-2023]
MFGSFLFNALAFVVALGALIAIHEFGHFWVARKSGVKVLRFSIGFGKPLFSRRGKKDETEYVLAAIPLGGYVKMLDEREGPVPAHERHRAFNTQSVWTRIAIVAAGPVANFLLAIAAYWLMFVIGISGIKPLLGDVPPDTPAAQAGFVAGETVVSVAGSETRTWNDVRMAVLDSAMGSDGTIALVTESSTGEQHTRYLPVDSAQVLQGQGDLLAEMGLGLQMPDIEPVIAGVQPDGAAQAAGMQAGDRILAVNGQAVDSWQSWVETVRASPQKALDVLVGRDGGELALTLIPAARETASGTIGFIGVWEDASREWFDSLRTTVSFGPLEALSSAALRTWDMSAMTVQMIGKLITGQASIDNISGPITIAQFAGQSASIGIDHFLGFLALISISLGVLNLLPVPVLDGGHLLYFFIEIIKGKPLSERAQLFGQQLGMLLLVGMMSIAFYNDVVRLVG